LVGTQVSSTFFFDFGLEYHHATREHREMTIFSSIVNELILTKMQQGNMRIFVHQRLGVHALYCICFSLISFFKYKNQARLVKLGFISFEFAYNKWKASPTFHV
jgi:hypothetical protein